MSQDTQAPCCGNFETCTKPCTPRGAYLQESGRPLHPDEARFVAVGPNPIYYMTVPGYESLASVLHRAYSQAASGKGAERHAQGQPFDQQPMQQLIALHGLGFATGQAGKKSQEALRLPRDRAVAELLGAINYLAGAVIALERQSEN